MTQPRGSGCGSAAPVRVLLGLLCTAAALALVPAPASAAQEIATVSSATQIPDIVIRVDRGCTTSASKRLRIMVTETKRCARSGRVMAPTDAARATWTLTATYPGGDGARKSALVSTPQAGAQTTDVVYVEGRQPEAPESQLCSFTESPTADFGVSTPADGWNCSVVERDGTRRRWLVQRVPKRATDFGGAIGANGYTLYVSSWTLPAEAPGQPSWANAGAPATQATYDLPPLGLQTFDGMPRLLAYARWSKFSPGGYQGYLKGRHFQLLFGSFTYSGYGVYGPGNRFGAPTNEYGRNVYINTYNSDYGPGWRRIMGVLTQAPNGSFCYEIGPKGASKGKTGQGQKYRLAAIGPGLTPVVYVMLQPPEFPFGAPDYNPKTMPWGTGFSAEQAQALRNQAAMIGPAYLTKPKGARNTDCGQTLRQLPPSFFAPAG